MVIIGFLICAFGAGMKSIGIVQIQQSRHPMGSNSCLQRLYISRMWINKLCPVLLLLQIVPMPF